MVSGSVDVSYDDPITCIVSTAGGVPVNVIVGGTPSLAYLIVGGPGVKTMADVKGKRVGSSGLGPVRFTLGIVGRPAPFRHRCR